MQGESGAATDPAGQATGYSPASLSGVVLTLPGDSLPMGRLRLVATAGRDTAPGVPLVVTLTDRWMASNFDEVADGAQTAVRCTSYWGRRAG